jgi:hypothetical protein
LAIEDLKTDAELFVHFSLQGVTVTNRNAGLDHCDNDIDWFAGSAAPPRIRPNLGLDVVRLDRARNRDVFVASTATERLVVAPLVAARTDGSGPGKEVRGDGSACKAKTELLKLVVTVSRAKLGQLKADVLSQLDRIGHQVISQYTSDTVAVSCSCNCARPSSPIA